MKKTLSLLLLLCMLTLLSCSEKSKAYSLPFSAGAYEAEIRVTSDTYTYSARICADAPKEGSPIRGASLTFLSPSSLSGLTVECRDGKTTARFGSHSIALTNTDAFFSSLAPLLETLSVTDVRLCELDGKKATVADAVYKDRYCEILLSENGVPLSISEENSAIEFVWFEKK